MDESTTTIPKLRKPRLLSASATSAYGAGTGGIFSYMIQWGYFKVSHGDVMPEGVAIGFSVVLTWFFVRLSDVVDKMFDRYFEKKQNHL